MKYIFLLGSNTYVVNKPVVNFIHDGEQTEVLNIGVPHRAEHKLITLLDLVLYTNVTDVDGHPVILADDDLNHSSYKVKRIDKCVHVFDKCDDLIIGVCLLDKEALKGLNPDTLSQINEAGPSVIMRLRGDFMVDEHHIYIDYEKMYIDDDVHQNELHFSTDGIKLNDDPNAIAA